MIIEQKKVKEKWEKENKKVRNEMYDGKKNWSRDK